MVLWGIENKKKPTTEFNFYNFAFLTLWKILKDINLNEAKPSFDIEILENHSSYLIFNQSQICNKSAQLFDIEPRLYNKVGPSGCATIYGKCSLLSINR